MSGGSRARGWLSSLLDGNVLARRCPGNTPQVQWRRRCLVAAVVAVFLPAALAAPGDTSEANSDAYQEVTANLDAATRERGGKLYSAHCARCHDGGVVRAPQRYLLEQGSPETILAAMTDGLMQEVARELSVADRTAVAEFITGRKLVPGDPALAGVPCDKTQLQFQANRPAVFSHWGFDSGGSHYIPQDVAKLAGAQLPSLGVDWAFAFPAATRARSQPAVGGGAIFVGSQSGLVYAFDQTTGCTRWQFRAAAEIRNAITLEPWSADEPEADPLLFFGDATGNQYAVAARSGELRWKKRIDPHGVTTLTAAAELYDGVLYVPVSSLEEGAAISAGYPCCTFRGSVVALVAANGEELWRRHFIPPAIPQGENAVGTPRFGPSGVPVWAGLAFDGDRLLVATGDDYTGEGSDTSDAIIALDRTTGEILWVQQARAADVWNGSCEEVEKINCPEVSGPDWDYGAGPVVATGKSGRQFVLAGDKGAIVSGLDPETGAVRWKNKVGRGGVVAGINFGLAAHGGRVFVPVSDVPDGRTYEEPAKPGLYALDVDTGALLWAAPSVEDHCRGRPGCYPGYSAAITVTDEYVLAGSNDGRLLAHDIETGAIIWSWDTTEPVTAVDGRVASGGSIGGGQAPLIIDGHIILNSGYAFAGKMPGNALLVLSVNNPVTASR